MKLDLQAKIENPNILLYVKSHPQGILLFWYWKMRSFPQSNIRTAKCPQDKVALYMYIYVYTHTSNSIIFSSNSCISHFKGFVIVNILTVQEKVYFYVPNLLYLFPNLANLPFWRQSWPFCSHEVWQFFSNCFPSTQQYTISKNYFSEQITTGNFNESCGEFS